MEKSDWKEKVWELDESIF